MRVLDDGSYAISGEIDVPGEGTQDFMFARGWLLEVMEIVAGEFGFVSDRNRINPSSPHFGVFYPSYSFVRVYSRDIAGRNFGIGSEATYDELPTMPFIFETDHMGEFTSIEHAIGVIGNARNRRSIMVNTTPSDIALNAKRLIDENYLIYPSISRIAARLGVSHEHVSRQFKRDYGLTPSAYLHNLRVAEATFRLSRGEEIIEISGDVGYNDLSRFYKQFRKSTSTSPAACRKQMDS